MTEAAGPLVVAVGEGSVGPSVLVADAVVVAAERAEVAFFCRSAVSPSGAMVEVAADGAIVEDKSGKKESLEADSVVFALGSRSNRRLVEALKDKVKTVYAIGDCVRPGRVHNAVQEAAHLAREI